VVATLSIAYPDATVSVVDSDGDAWVPEGDLLTVVLDELARNALAHADGSDPSVSFEVTADDETVSIAVADDGPGLPPVERRLLTQSFEETPTEHSSGLGLWLVKWLVRWADGEIDVTVDDGTVVTVTVPRGSSAGESDD
jgi:signal transduction histidine kinase